MSNQAEIYFLLHNIKYFIGIGVIVCYIILVIFFNIYKYIKSKIKEKNK